MELSVLILQIITIIISVGSVAANVALTVRENKKEHLINVITNQRLENKSRVRNGAQTLLALTADGVAKPDDREALVEISKSVAQIEATLKPIYKEDKRLIDAARNLLAAAVAENSETFRIDLGAARREFYKDYSRYDHADWIFIKRQASGQPSDSDDFDEIYASLEDSDFL